MAATPSRTASDPSEPRKWWSTVPCRTGPKKMRKHHLQRSNIIDSSISSEAKATSRQNRTDTSIMKGLYCRPGLAQGCKSAHGCSFSTLDMSTAGKTPSRNAFEQCWAGEPSRHRENTYQNPKGTKLEGLGSPEIKTWRPHGVLDSTSVSQRAALGMYSVSGPEKT